MKSRLLKAFSTAAFTAVVFPFLFVCDVNRYGNIDVLRLLIYYAVLFAVGFIGWLLGEAAKVHKRLRIPERIIGIFSFGVGFLSLAMGGDVATFFALGAYAVFVFFIGERFGLKNFSDMFPIAALAFYIVLGIGCYIFAAAAVEESIRQSVTWIIAAQFACEFAAAALLMNQTGIYDKANMRKETRASLPKGLAGYNAALVLGFSVIGLVFCLFIDKIVWFLKQTIIVVMQGFMFITGLHNAESMETEYAESELGLGGSIEAEPNYIWEIIGAVVILVLIIVFRKKIIELIKAFFSKLGSLLSGKTEESETIEFTDVFEEIAVGKSDREKPMPLSKLEKLYRNETDITKKYRYGYRILLMRIKEKNIKLSPADTTHEQAEKGREALDEKALVFTADSYDCLRYNGEDITAEQLSILDKLIGKER